jgi:endogenous inhibitor of DNA gyrase (YacG/DUF329 family)
MKFPLLKGDHYAHPKKALCPQCKKQKVLEPHSMAIFSGGAMYLGKKKGVPDDLEGIAGVTWHGAHDNGVGGDRDIYTSVDLAEGLHGGQFEIYFCSTRCLRAFFNSWVDALDAKIQKERKKMANRVAGGN